MPHGLVPSGRENIPKQSQYLNAAHKEKSSDEHTTPHLLIIEHA